MIVNYSNSQRAGVILYLTALIFGAYGRVSIPGVALRNTYQWLIIDICVEQNLCNIFIFA